MIKNIDDKIEVGIIATELHNSWLTHLRNNEAQEHLRLLAVIYGYYTFLECEEIIKLCGYYFDFLQERNYIWDEEREELKKYGLEKAEFLIRLQLEGRRFLESRRDDVDYTLH